MIEGEDEGAAVSLLMLFALGLVLLPAFFLDVPREHSYLPDVTGERELPNSLSSLGTPACLLGDPFSAPAR